MEAAATDPPRLVLSEELEGEGVATLSTTLARIAAKGDRLRVAAAVVWMTAPDAGDDAERREWSELCYRLRERWVAAKKEGQW